MGFVKVSSLFLLGFLVFGSTVHISLCAGGSIEAASAIEEADNAVRQGFAAVLEAEKGGADVSSLLISLNLAGTFLAKAQMCYRNGDFGGAVYHADLSVQSVEGLVEEAGQLKSLSIAKHREKSFQMVTTSSVAVAVIVLGSLVGWRLFKKRYSKKVLKMKPEEVKG